MDAQDVGMALSVLGAVGWVFKIWIIAPLNVSVESLKEMVEKANDTIENYRQLSSQMAQDITEATVSAKSAHKRCDDLSKRLHALEMRCTECCRRDD